MSTGERSDGLVMPSPDGLLFEEMDDVQRDMHVGSLMSIALMRAALDIHGIAVVVVSPPLAGTSVSVESARIVNGQHSIQYAGDKDDIRLKLVEALRDLADRIEAGEQENRFGF